jgi:cytochrome oxidase Cu insertion factor (SCO1/SenC/PrrC family)/cytochrome c2
MQRPVLAALAAAALAVAVPAGLQAQVRPYGPNWFPNLPVVTQDGKTVQFYDDLIKGKIVIVSFIYTSCPDICSISTARLTQVEDKLGNRMGKDFFIISMTVDPENDTPERLKEYSKAFGTGPGWTFVTGKPEDVRAINAKLGDRSKKLADHRNEIVVGNDATGQWQRDSVFGDLDRLLMAIRGLDPKWDEEARVIPNNPASNTGYQVPTEPGQALFRKMCAPCHTIGVGDRVGPDLRGVVQLRDRGWLAKFISNPAKMRAEKDPIALELAARFPAVQMPRMGISEMDAGDLITYLENQTAKLTEAQTPPGAPAHDHSQHQHHKH